MNLQEWNELYRKTGGNEYDFLRKHRSAKVGEGEITIRNCNKTIYIECTPEKTPFRFHKCCIPINN